jgi:hypothetical protein
VRENTLAPDDWLVLEKLHSSLNIFYLATMHTQGNEHTASLYLSEMQYLLDRLFDIQVDYAEQATQSGKTEFTVAAEAASSAYTKCKKYFDLIDETPAYFAAQALDPSIRKLWLQQNWQQSKDPIKQSWYQPTLNAITKMWLEDYKGKYTSPEDPDAIAKARATAQAKIDADVRRDKEELYHRSANRVRYTNTTEDALEAYLNGVAQEGQNALTFAEEISISQPDLSAFIYDMASIPIMSAECERIFSSAKLLLSDQRARMKPILIEAYECLRHWMFSDNLFTRDPPINEKEYTAQQQQQEEEDEVEEIILDNDSDSDDEAV